MIVNTATVLTAQPQWPYRFSATVLALTQGHRQPFVRGSLMSEYPNIWDGAGRVGVEPLGVRHKRPASACDDNQMLRA